MMKIYSMDELSEYCPKIPLMEFGVPAGFPSPARDYVENCLSLNELMIRNPPATYFVRIEGFSMIGANLRNGDIVIVDKSIEPYSNSIVIAVIDGEVTVKRLKIIKGEYWLYPENDRYNAMKISKNDDFTIFGVVTWILHQAR